MCDAPEKGWSALRPVATGRVNTLSFHGRTQELGKHLSSIGCCH